LSLCRPRRPALVNLWSADVKLDEGVVGVGNGAGMSDSIVRDEDRRRIEAFVADYLRSPYAVSDGKPVISVIRSPIDEEMVRDHENLLGAALPPFAEPHRSLPGRLVNGQVNAILC
jgi:hypothetical protein